MTARTTSIRVERDTLERLDRLARSMDRSRSWIVNRAIEQYLEYEEWFAEAVRAEGIPDCYGPYAGGVPMYKTGMFVNEHTYGRSRYPFVDEQGRRRVDYTKVRLPNVESELPKTGFILLRNSYTDDDAHDIAAAMRKVSSYYASRRAAP